MGMENRKNKEQKEMRNRRRRRTKKEGNIVGICAVNILTYFSCRDHQLLRCRNISSQTVRIPCMKYK